MREHSWSFTGTTGVSMLTSLLIRTKDTSPTTGATLESKKLIPNHSLRSIIRRFTEERTVAFGTATAKHRNNLRSPAHCR